MLPELYSVGRGHSGDIHPLVYQKYCSPVYNPAYFRRKGQQCPSGHLLGPQLDQGNAASHSGLNPGCNFLRANDGAVSDEAQAGESQLGGHELALCSLWAESG